MSKVEMGDDTRTAKELWEGLGDDDEEGEGEDEENADKGKGTGADLVD